MVLENIIMLSKYLFSRYLRIKFSSLCFKRMLFLKINLVNLKQTVCMLCNNIYNLSPFICEGDLEST